MKELDCGFIRDVFPLYGEGLLEEGNRRLVEEHMENCEECRKAYAAYAKELALPAVTKPVKADKWILSRLRLPYLVISHLFLFGLMLAAVWVTVYVRIPQLWFIKGISIFAIGFLFEKATGNPYSCGLSAAFWAAFYGVFYLGCPPGGVALVVCAGLFYALGGYLLGKICNPDFRWQGWRRVLLLLVTLGVFVGSAVPTRFYSNPWEYAWTKSYFAAEAKNADELYGAQGGEFALEDFCYDEISGLYLARMRRPGEENAYRLAQAREPFGLSVRNEYEYLATLGINRLEEEETLENMLVVNGLEAFVNVTYHKEGGGVFYMLPDNEIEKVRAVPKYSIFFPHEEDAHIRLSVGFYFSGRRTDENELARKIESALEVLNAASLFYDEFDAACYPESSMEGGTFTEYHLELKPEEARSFTAQDIVGRIEAVETRQE